MTLEELVLHPVQLETVDLISVECNKYENYAAQNNEVNIQVTIEATEIQDSMGTTAMSMKLRGEGFCLSIKQNGLFKFHLEKEKVVLKRFLETQGVKLMWPYFREVIYDISGRMLERPISIPTIDVMATLRKAVNTED